MEAPIYQRIVKKENQDNYYELRDMLSKIDWNDSNWRMHILEFKKLEKEAIHKMLLRDKSISSLDRMFLYCIELEQTLEQNMRMESTHDTIDELYLVEIFFSRDYAIYVTKLTRLPLLVTSQLRGIHER